MLHTVCCYGLFPRGPCVHSSPKNRACLWQHCCRHMWHARELSQSLSGFTTKSVLFLYLLFFLSPSSSDIMFFLCLLNPHETSLFFFIARIPAHSISSISVWHMIAAVKTALILDNTHFCWLLILPAGSWNTQRYKNRIMLQQKRHKQSDTRRFQQDSRKKNMENTLATTLQTVRHKFSENVSDLCNLSQRLGFNGGTWEVFCVLILYA